MILRARHVVTAAGPPIENGMLDIQDGRIVRVERVRGPAPHGAIDFGDAVLCPGFVNAHTHLELSALARRVPPSPSFTDWLLRVIRESAAYLSDEEAIRTSVRSGVRRSLRAGVTAVGDITRHPATTRSVLAESPLTAVSFGEVTAIGTRRSLGHERIAAAIARGHDPSNVPVGISPHAPYSVDPDVLRECAQAAQENDLPVTIHVAETADEASFTETRSGAFVGLLRSLGIWDEAIPISGRTPVSLLADVGLLTPRCVLAHANYLTPGDADLIRRSGASVAYCPRTHAAFGHPPHPFRDLLRSGVNVCLATDSLASNPSLSVLDEARFVRRMAPEVDALLLLEMITIHPARALGLERDLGTLEPGKRADVNVLPLAAGEPWTAVFENGGDPRETYIRGARIDAAYGKSQ